jgi:hypothetical protein
MAQQICADVDPPPVDLGDGQQAWCHFAGETTIRDRVPNATSSIGGDG